MTEEEQQAVDKAMEGSRDPTTRRIRAIAWAVVGVAIVVSLVSGWVIYNSIASSATTLAAQVQEECTRGVLKGAICDQADDTKKVVPAAIPVPGVPGNDGERGAKGDKGDKGDQGEPGKRGPKGNDGDDGEDAVAIDGKDGKAGADGSNGASAYELAVGTGFQGTLEDWLASLKGERGNDGAKGDKGDDAWPFSFVFTFTTRAGRTYDCPVEIGEGGQQTGTSACQPRAELPPEQPEN